MGHALFEHADFLDAARAVAAAHGPAAVTVGSVTERLKAPRGSFYYRFASRDLLLGELWLATVLAFQEGFVAAIEAGDGLAAALHTPAWVRGHLDDARAAAALQSARLRARRLAGVAEARWSSTRRGVSLPASSNLRMRPLRVRTPTPCAAPQFVLADAPTAAVRPHLQRREIPPVVVDDLVRATYHAIVKDYAARARARVGKTAGNDRSRRG